MKTKAFSGDWEIASDTTRAVSIAGKVRRSSLSPEWLGVY
jgi:hypothetical protein